MRHIIPVFLALLIACCKVPEGAAASEKELIPIEIVFTSEEAIKLIPYKLRNFNLSLTNSLNGVERGYSATILVSRNHLDSILDKIDQEVGVQAISQIDN